jgi:hypothetical protein
MVENGTNDEHLVWGDMHTQFEPLADESLETWEQRIRTAMESGGKYFDFMPIVFYPAFFSLLQGGLRTETVGMRPEFAERWEVVKRLAREYDDPGSFVTFPAYEWTSDRSTWGDHNVFFNEHDPPLDLSMDLPDLIANMKPRSALVIPHHTGYNVGNRGKDWACHDEEVSPFMEVYSKHGSSEGCQTPNAMMRNGQMSPRTSGGTLADGLARGYRLGIIASGDNAEGFGGMWGQGHAAVLTDELSRDGLWRAFRKRRVYGVTGDRIKLDYRLNGASMGDEIQVDGPVQIGVGVVCTRALDRIEIIRDGRVVYTHCHNGSWQRPVSGNVRVKIPIECGWGPSAKNGFAVDEHIWRGTLKVSAGRIVSTEGCYTTHGQFVEQPSDRELVFQLRSIDRPGPGLGWQGQQSIVVEVEAPADAPVVLEVNGLRDEFTLSDAMQGGNLTVFDAEARALVRDQFGIDPETFENRATFYNNSWKMKRHTATPQVGFIASFEWEDADVTPGRHWYYVRVSQLSGQMAWSSPIWVDIGNQ